MSGVLDAMDRAFEVLDARGARASADELIEARAAIANLVEAAIPVTKFPACTKQQAEKFRAALTRVLGVDQ